VTGTVLHLSPHPDDELIGAPATLMALRDAGWRVVNLACGLGPPSQRARREGELREACSRAGFELRLASVAESNESGTLGTGSPCSELLADVTAAIEAVGPALVVSPTPRDRHPAHEAVTAATREALHRIGANAPRWWMWGLWGSQPRPTLGTAFDHERLEEILAALSAHRGELERNDYRRLVRGRAEANACLAPELLFGFGSPARPSVAYAELLTELVFVGSGWRLGARRWLDSADPMPPPSGGLAAADATDAGDLGRDDPTVGEVESALGE
jgi:LmbE family N-acetylglucosaminyl deacetylase